METLQFSLFSSIFLLKPFSYHLFSNSPCYYFLLYPLLFPYNFSKFLFSTFPIHDKKKKIRNIYLHFNLSKSHIFPLKAINDQEFSFSFLTFMQLNTKEGKHIIFLAISFYYSCRKNKFQILFGICRRLVI